ncbi:hypothetical protein [Peterkaempfera sp. SMS 1(5)a]|uniref:hypothetical protein n=1 Tax=Peterkaempfera podocarpi TaxID=3232308 RepID=UPI00366B7E31
MDRNAVSRGLRFGLRAGAVPAVVWGALCLVGTVDRLLSGSWQEAAAILGRGLLAAAGSVAVGALLGVVTGTAPAVAPPWPTSRGALRGAPAALVGGVVFPGELVVVAVASDGGYGPMLLTPAAVPVVAGAAAACSGDIAGGSRRHSWLWVPRVAHGLATLFSADGSRGGRARRALKLLR